MIPGTYTDLRSGISITHDGSAAGREFYQLFVRGAKESQERERVWIAHLRARHVTAAHPDDGWVDRELNRVHFAYPQFYDHVRFGDVIALGSPDRYRLVRVTGIETSGPISGHLWYSFEDLDGDPLAGTKDLLCR